MYKEVTHSLNKFWAPKLKKCIDTMENSERYGSDKEVLAELKSLYSKRYYYPVWISKKCEKALDKACLILKNYHGYHKVSRYTYIRAVRKTLLGIHKKRKEKHKVWRRGHENQKLSEIQGFMVYCLSVWGDMEYSYSKKYEGAWSSLYMTRSGDRLLKRDLPAFRDKIFISLDNRGFMTVKRTEDRIGNGVKRPLRAGLSKRGMDLLNYIDMDYFKKKYDTYVEENKIY
jgi:hypothetical protein